jgi:pilus assembly protein CpaE
MNNHDTAKVWRPQGREAEVQVYLSGADSDTADLLGERVSGLPLRLNLVPVTDWIDPAELNSAAVAVLQVDPDAPASIKRFERLAAASETPLIAASYNPPLALVRSLLRNGAHDVLPLPLTLNDLETSVAPLLKETSAKETQANSGTTRLVTFIKGRGGSGTTALANQLACLFAQSEAKHGRGACLIDFDVQFGDSAFQLGLAPKLTLGDLIEAGARLDGELLRSVAVAHPCSLQVIASPSTMLPLEAINIDQVIAIVDSAQREFGTVFIDLPANWTHWSLSLVARSDLVMLVTELTVASLHQARRQLDLLQEQGLGELELRVIVNRFEKGLFRSVKPTDVAQVLGRDASFTVANDPSLMNAAVDRGVLISELKRKSTLGRDLSALDVGLAEALKLER